MIYKTFSVYDCKAEVFGPPNYHKTTGLAIRTFIDAINEENHSFKLHAADYTLFETGIWDDATGDHTALPEGKKINLGVAIQFVTNTPDKAVAEGLGQLALEKPPLGLVPQENK